MNDSPRVSPDVRLSVQAAIEQLGYTPNRAARSLVTRRSDSVAVVITQPTGQVFSDPFFPRLLRGISSALAASDRQLVLLMPESPADERRAVDYLTAGHVDGALLVSLHENDPLPARLAAAGVPIVMVGRPPHGIAGQLRGRRQPPGRPGGGRAPHRLRAAGHRHDHRTPRTRPRASTACRATGTPSPRRAWRLDSTLEAMGGFTQEGSAAAMQRLLATRPDIDAVFAASDLMAASALAVITAAGRRVPADVAVVGFDDMAIAMSTTPHLTSVRQPIEEMGHEMARLLIESLDAADPVPRRVILATQLVRRASSAGRRSP